MTRGCTRRSLLKRIGQGLAVACLPTRFAFARDGRRTLKSIPVSGEPLPAIGLGTWRTFNVGSDSRMLDDRTEVVRAFFAHGGGLVDSSPMYGSAPDLMGHALEVLGHPDTLFAAEKVWSPAGGDAYEQFNELLERWRVRRFDLVQVHNLVDWREQLEALRQMKAEGKLRYIGITTSHGRRHREFEQVMADEALDFVQLTYNLTHREAENRLLPLALERGLAVIANRPYDGGRLVKWLKRSEPVPEWASQAFGCRTWADYLLRFIVSHPAVTCAIPATTRVDHLEENMAAGLGSLPSPEVRARMVRHVESL
ncbi:MAG: aldo/keto reductase [Gammaproteobacteria bacterium]|jgi:diketogulonate reductase-like aldo/keto reductase|nr:aldo/keto reductase [Gammaproteobacteria bacterium]